MILANVLSTIGYILIALLVLMLMVVIHELGHYLAGKLLGFKIMEFSIGFGPKIFSRKSKKTGEVFAIRPFPLGGFCQFEDEDDDSKSPTAFNNQPPWKRLIVLFSGALFNFMSAIIIITFFFTLYGQILPTVYAIYPDSITATANDSFLEGDAIISINGSQVNILQPEDINAVFSKAGDKADFVVIRDGKKVKITANKSNYTVLDKDGNPKLDEDGKIVINRGFGISIATAPVKMDFFTSLSRSFSFCFFIVGKILSIFGQLFTGQLGMENMGGPITVIDTIKTATEGGLAVLSYTVCIISANLAVMNLLPLPALDGSRMVFCLIEWIFKKPINKKIEGIIHTVGIILLFGFAIFADIFRFINLR